MGRDCVVRELLLLPCYDSCFIDRKCFCKKLTKQIPVEFYRISILSDFQILPGEVGNVQVPEVVGDFLA